MPLTDYITRETLIQEGFVDSKDKEMMIEALTEGRIDPNARIPIYVAAGMLNGRYGKVTTYRLEGFLQTERCGIKPDENGCLTLKQIMEYDWSDLLNKKRTYIRQ